MSTLTSELALLDLSSCLISKHGELIFAYAKNEHTPVEMARINSCTKSILSALICIAMDQGTAARFDDACFGFLPRAGWRRG